MTPRPPALHPFDPLLPDRLDGSTSWEEVDDLLTDEWLAMEDSHGRCLIRVRDGLGLVEHPGLLRARERRGLHRSGFRLERAGDLRVWLWVPPDEPSLDPAAPADVVAALRRWAERGRAVRQQAIRTVRDVLGADVTEVVVVLLPEPEDQPWDDEWEDCGCGGPATPGTARDCAC